MEANSLVPKLRFKDKDGKDFPEWEEKQLGEILSIASGRDYKNLGKGDIPVYGTGGLMTRVDKYLYEGDSVGIGRKGTIDKPVMLRGKFWTVDTLFYTHNFKNSTPKFVFYLFQRIVWYRYNEASGVPSLSKKTIEKILKPFPSYSEQCKIAEFLSNIDKKINLLTKKKALLETYNKGVMQKIFSQEIRFKDEDGKDFPDWEEKNLGEMMSERNIKAPKSKSYPLMSFVAYKGVRSKGKRYNREFLVNDESNKKYKKTEYGDFIYSSNNLETGSIGLNRFGAASISPVYSIFKIGELCNYQFISSYLLRKIFINKMTRFRQGVVYGQWKIHESNFLKIKDKFPSLEEQNKIADFLSSLDKKIELVDFQLERNKEFKKGLLQQMFV